ncbi:MAG: cation transporter [Gemmatimonadota bacterium]|nr:MAG: cation transporter [Gemmatimonadota bacterium]
MKRKILVLLLTLIIFCAHGFSCGPKQKIVTAGDEGTIERRVYEVFGMDCPGCHGGLEKLVEKNQSVLKAEANWEKKQLVVHVRPGAQLSDEDIYDAIVRANFTPGNRIQ